MVLCVVRTFLPPPAGGARWNGLLQYKGNKNRGNLKIAIFGTGFLRPE